MISKLKILVMYYKLKANAKVKCMLSESFIKAETISSKLIIISSKHIMEAGCIFNIDARLRKGFTIKYK